MWLEQGWTERFGIDSVAQGTGISQMELIDTNLLMHANGYSRCEQDSLTILWQQVDPCFKVNIDSQIDSQRESVWRG